MQSSFRFFVDPEYIDFAGFYFYANDLLAGTCCVLLPGQFRYKDMQHAFVSYSEAFYVSVFYFDAVSVF